MKDIPRSEAESYLQNQLTCVDIAWDNAPSISPFTLAATSGVVDETGTRKGFFVELTYYSHPKTKQVRFLFTLYKKNPWGPERVYQLDILQSPRKLKDAHKASHEHIGDFRQNGSENWNNWKFEDALQHFMKMTNIRFEPRIDSPEKNYLNFELS